jgi:glycosyltransferase involved in cell wall biosynthesis
VRLLILVRSFEHGGAQRQIVGLAGGLARGGTPVTVATFYGTGELRGALQQTGVPLVCLDKRSRWDLVGFLGRLRRLVRAERPTVLHSYLDSANLAAVLLKPWCPGVRVVWGVRASNMELDRYGWLERLQAQLMRRLARFADLIIVNSEAGRDYAAARGFPADRMLVIPNGIDTGLFRRDAEAGRRCRAAWEIGADETVIGHVGRLDPMKDHPTLLDAAAQLARERPDVRFVCIGDGPEPYRRRLLALCAEAGLDERVRWVASQADMPAAYNAFDVMTLPSAFGEGFPNALGEAMACGVPCVVTDVGDCRTIVGETGLVVRPRDPGALAAAWRAMLALDRTARAGQGERARGRIMGHFALDRLIADTRRALEPLA